MQHLRNKTINRYHKFRLLKYWMAGTLTIMLTVLLSGIQAVGAEDQATRETGAQGGIASSSPPAAAVAQQSDTTEEQSTRQTKGDDRILSGHRGLVGREIRNSDNETIGEIQNIVTDLEGQQVQAVVSVGGFWGIGEEEIIVPLNKFRLTQKRPYVFFNGTQEDLASYPAYRDPIYRSDRGPYPYRGYYPPRDAYDDRDQEERRGDAGGMGRSYYRDFGERDHRGYFGPGRMPQYGHEDRPRGYENRYDRPGESSARQNNRLLASELIGKSVRNAADEEIGTVDDLIVGRNGRLTLLISVGGFLGIGDKKVRADIQDVDLDNPDYVFYDISKNELENEANYAAGNRLETNTQSDQNRKQQGMGQKQD